VSSLCCSFFRSAQRKSRRKEAPKILSSRSSCSPDDQPSRSLAPKRLVRRGRARCRELPRENGSEKRAWTSSCSTGLVRNYQRRALPREDFFFSGEVCRRKFWMDTRYTGAIGSKFNFVPRPVTLADLVIVLSLSLSLSLSR